MFFHSFITINPQGGRFFRLFHFLQHMNEVLLPLQLGILHNLIGNSLKFTPSGGHIVVSVEQKSDRGIIRVRDTGSGMTQDQVKAIFKPFQQVSEEKEKRRVGTGLGLSIVSQFTQLMSGTVDVESQKGEGTTFTLSFPLTT